MWQIETMTSIISRGGHALLAALVLLILFVWPLMLCALFRRIIVPYMQSMEEVGHQLSRQVLDYHLFEVNRHLKGEVDILVVSTSPRQCRYHHNPYLFIPAINTTTHLFKPTIGAIPYLFRPTISAIPYLFRPTISATPYLFKPIISTTPYFFRPTFSLAPTSSDPSSVQPPTSLDLPPLQPPTFLDPSSVQSLTYLDPLSI